jgi:hypothetical protein
MAVVSKTRTYATGGSLTASNYNDDRDEIIAGVNSISNAQIVSGAAIDPTKIAGTAATLTGSETLTNKTLTAPIISTISNTGTITLPTSTDTLVGKATTDTLTNKTLTNPRIDVIDRVAQTYAPSVGSTATLDLSLGDEHRVAMPAGNITLALSNDTNSKRFIVSLTQDSSGSRTVTWFTTIRWVGGSAPVLTTTANKRDVFGFIRTGSSTYDGFIIGQNL